MMSDVPWRCPLTAAPLQPRAPQSGDPTDWPEGLTGVLAADGVAYPVVDDIPLLTVEMARGAAVPPSPVEAERHEEIREEVDIYDKLAANDQAQLDKARIRLLGARLDSAARSWSVPGPFPDPPSVWVDSVGSADTQEAAYRHLAPLTGARFLQLGGSGSHAIKALLAGARTAALISPSLEEVRLGRAMARDLGVHTRFVGLVGIGELIPLADDWVDRVYGGGCLHHTDIEHSLPELSRVLAPGGRAAFVDPQANPIYSTWSKVLGARIRFCGDEEGTHDHPLDVDRVRTLVGALFSEASIYASGGPLRYGVILSSRTIGLNPSPRWASRLYRAERRVLSTLRLDRLFGNLALRLVR